MKKMVFVLPGIKGGGAERVVLNLIRVMTRFCACECHLISLSREVQHLVDPQINLHFLTEIEGISKKGLGRLTYRKKMAGVVDAYIERVIGSDCIVFSNMLHADKIMSLSNLDVIHIIHNSYSEALLGSKPFYKKMAIKKNINKVYENNKLVFVSQGAFDSFCENFRTRGDKYTIYNPIDREELVSLSNEGTENLGFEYLVHVGRFNRQKRHDRLLKAFRGVPPTVKLLLLGEGKLEGQIKTLVKEYGLEDRVVFMGFQKNPYPYVKNAKALVLSSDFEGLPMVLLEATSLGVPVITTDCPGGVREIIAPETNSLVPMDDIDALTRAMKDVLVNPDRYISSFQEQFDSHVIADSYRSLFRED